MGTVVFDFDSTLVSCESLERHLAEILAGQEDCLLRVDALTRAGMDGVMSFRDSLEQRLALVEVKRAALVELGEKLWAELSAGASELVTELHAREHQVWILSGAFRECLLPVARKLGIPQARVHGIRAHWDEAGTFVALDDGDPFSRSKLAGARRLGRDWRQPRIGVGDGMTDYALFEDDLLDYFFVYTEHVRREAVLAKGVDEVDGMPALRRRLEELL